MITMVHKEVYMVCAVVQALPVCTRRCLSSCTLTVEFRVVFRVVFRVIEIACFVAVHVVLLGVPPCRVGLAVDWPSGESRRSSFVGR